MSYRVRASLAGHGQHGGRWRSLPRPGRPAGRLLTGKKVNTSHMSANLEIFSGFLCLGLLLIFLSDLLRLLQY